MAAVLPPMVEVSPRTERSLAHTSWDAESSTLLCEMDYPDPQPPRSPIDVALRIPVPRQRLTLNDLDLLVQDRRWVDLSLHGSPGDWVPTPLPPLVAVDAAWIVFQVEYDGNGIASFDLPWRLCWDPSHRTLGIVFAERPVARWVAVADTVLAAVDSTSRLGQLRLTGVELP